MSKKIKNKEMHNLQFGKANKKVGVAEVLDKLSQRTAPLMRGIPASDKIGEMLYDPKTGLPK